MKDHQESRGKPRQIHLKWQEAEGNRLRALVGSSFVALEDPRAPGDPDHPKEVNLVQVLARKTTPAAVCLVASMLASVASGIPIMPTKVFCPSTGIRFADEADVYRIAACGNMWPIVDKPPRN